LTCAADLRKFVACVFQPAEKATKNKCKNLYAAGNIVIKHTPSQNDSVM
jgi:hypothetical protein